jgi:heparan-alpha-glucosaminide N-acetyltransferase
VPGCPTGYLGAGGLADNGAYPGCTGGAHRALDVWLFGEAHIYHDVGAGGAFVSSATCAPDYQCAVYDPEGVLGWLSAAWMCWLGVQAGRVVVSHRALLRGGPAERARGIAAHLGRWVAWGLACGLAGGALCGFAAEGGAIPINKNLWSPSFVLCLASVGFLALALLFVAIDVLGVWDGAPMTFMGMNSIALYVGSECLDGFFPFAARAGDSYASHAEALAGNLVGVSSWMAVARAMFLARVFVNL